VLARSGEAPFTIEQIWRDAVSLSLSLSLLDMVAAARGLGRDPPPMATDGESARTTTTRGGGRSTRDSGGSACSGCGFTHVDGGSERGGEEGNGGSRARIQR
jgi:hypothetical protein